MLLRERAHIPAVFQADTENLLSSVAGSWTCAALYRLTRSSGVTERRDECER